MKDIRETESLKKVPKLTSFGFKSKPKEIEGKECEGIQEDICDLSTEGQNQTISTFETITDVTNKEEYRLELESLARRPEKVDAKVMSTKVFC